MPGVVKVVRDGSFVAVVAEGEYQAIGAMRSLGRGATWDEAATLSPKADLYAELQSLPHDDYQIRGDAQRAPRPGASNRAIGGRIRCTPRSAHRVPWRCSRPAS